MSELGTELVRRVPLGLLVRTVRRDVLGINYHCVGAEQPRHAFGILPTKNPKQFETDLIYLKSRFRPIRYEELLACREERGSLPPNAVLVSFDDGFSLCHSVVRPLLLKHEIPCIFFVITSCIDNAAMCHRHKVALCLHRLANASDTEVEHLWRRAKESIPVVPDDKTAFRNWITARTIRDQSLIDSLCTAFEIDLAAYLKTTAPYMTWDEVRDLDRDGFCIGAHTRNHPEPWLCTPEEFESEMVSSCAEVSEKTGIRQVPFSFPFHSSRFSRKLLRDIRRRNSAVGLFFDNMGCPRDDACVVQRETYDDSAAATDATSSLEHGIRRLLLRQIVKHALGKGSAC